MTGGASATGWAIAVETVRPVSSGAIAWRSGGERWALTVVVKATFAITPDGPAELIAPAPLALAERFSEPGAGVVAPLVEEPDLAPYKPQVDVTFVGCVHAARPVQALRARLALYGDEAGVDRSLQAVGDRTGPGAAPLPFRQMPVGWDRTWASPDNPVGVPPGGSRQANLVDPANPAAAVSLGPVARGWPSRARLLGGGDRRWVEARVPEIPHDFRWEYFQAAPPGQRLARLHGAETILLENLLEGRPRVRTRLPSVRGCARLHAGWTGSEGQLLDLVADTLAIDGEAGSFSITWRASVPLPRADASLEGARVVTGVELPGFPMPWPGARSIASTRASAASIPALGGGAVAPPPPPPSSPGVPPPPPRASLPSAPALAPPSGGPGATMALTPEDAMRLLASAPRPVPFGTEPPPTSSLDPPTRRAMPIVGQPPPDPVEEATRQMAVGRLLDEEAASIDLGPRPGHPAAASPPTTMALTPEEASAMLAAAGRRLAAGGGFPPPLSPPVGPPPPPPVAPPLVAPPLAPPPTDDDVDSTGATFALTPEQAQRMMAEAAARKNGR